MTKNNPWLYDGREFSEEDIGDAFGFVYRITNTTNGKDYIGKKFFTKSKTKVIKGRRKRSRISSDWIQYYSSSEELNSDVKLLGEENFRREILRLCYSRSECTYYEAKYQFAEDVLLRDDSYCKWISAKIRRSPQLKGTRHEHDDTAKSSGRASKQNS
jgi:hypothetical protein